MLKIVQRSRDSRLDLVGSSRLASCQKLHVCQACGEVEASCQLEHYRTKSPIWSFSYLAAGTCGSVKSRGQTASQLCFEKLTIRIPFSHQYKYPLYPRNVKRFQREFWEKNPREKQDWLIHNLHIETLQISLLSHSPLLHPWEILCQILFSPYPHLWEDFLVLWEAIRKGPIHIGWCYGL